jgi:glycosyltransferase involved in cell wall biosynthesis
MMQRALRARGLKAPTRGCEPRSMGTLLSLFGITPNKVGSQEAYARELSLQLAQHGWRSILCFEGAPSEAVGRSFALPNVSLEVLESPERMRWQTLKRFMAILRKHRPDALHLHYVGFLGLYPALARLFSVRRVFFTDHSSRPASYVPRRAPLWKRGVTRLINWPLSGVVCVSGYGYRCMTALDVLPAARFHMIYNGVDIVQERHPNKAAEFRRKYGISESCPIVIQVSWIIPEKGIGDLLEAWVVVRKRHRRAQLVVVGDGPARDDYVRLAARMGLEDHVTWTGLIEDPLGEGVFAAADVVCQVSRWEEVFGFTIAEAMACGKPVVATRVGGIPELVEDGRTGFLVLRGDIEQIASRISTLLGDPRLRERLGSAGRDVAKEKFDLSKNITQLLQLYQLSRV